MYNKEQISNLRINDIAEAERPRERLLGSGAESLSNSELLAIIISSGTKNESAFILGNKVISLVDNDIALLSSCKVEEFKAIKGIGNATACRIAAAVELGKRINNSTIIKKKINDPQDIADYCSDLKNRQNEVFRILLFNVKLECIGKTNISVGCINSSYAEPRDIFSEAIRRGAFAIALVHNHPSGDPTPSSTDVETTKLLANCGKMLGIQVIDHVIIGDGKFYSFKNENNVL